MDPARTFTVHLQTMTWRDGTLPYTWKRRGADRRLRCFDFSVGGAQVGQLVVVDGGEYHGLVAFVRLATDYRGRGLGVEMHRIAQRLLGAPLLVDCCGFAATGDLSDRVEDCEIAVIDSAIRRPEWHVWLRGDGVVAMTTISQPLERKRKCGPRWTAAIPCTGARS